MKNKPLRHKESNTFRFIPFSERIANIKIDVVHQVKHKYELDSEETTFFYQTYEKWIVLNCCQSFEELRQDITPDVRTLPQLLARKDELINILKHHLSLKNPLNLQPLLEFIVALAKDIRQEFYPYFSSFYPLFISLLDVKNAEILEWVFQSLAYLFKYLWRYLLNNLTLIFESLLPLLDKSKPNYIHSFASQSFAFVARKIKDESKLIKLIVKPLKEKPYAVDGCSRLLFEIVKGISGHFHSTGQHIISSFILALRDSSFTHSSLCELLSQTLSHLLSFLNAKQVGLLWKILKDSLKMFHDDCKNVKNDRNIGNVEQILCMIQQSLEYKSCSLLAEPNILITFLLQLIEPDNQICQQISDRISQILAYILLSSRSLPQELSSRIVIGAMTYLNEEDLLTFVIRIKTYSGFDGLVLPRFITFCIEKSSPSIALPYLAKLVIHRSPPATDVRQLMVWAPYSLNFSLQKTEDPTTYSNCYLMTFAKRIMEDHLENFDDCIRILLVLPHILPLHKEEAVLSLKTLIESTCNKITQNKIDSDLTKLLFILSMAIETLIYLKSDACITKVILPEMILPVLLKYSSHNYCYVLRALDFYISLDELNETRKHGNAIKEHLCPLLLSPYQKVRMHVTHILYEVEKSIVENEISSSILETCWLAECVPVTLNDYREKLKILQKLDCSNELLRNSFSRNIVDGRLPLSYLLGVMFLNFKLLWEPVSKIIISYGTTLTPSAFWDVFGKQLENVAWIIREHRVELPSTITFAHPDFEYEFSKINDISEKPDFINYRIALWNILKDLPDIYEFKSKDIVLHFLSFLEKEYNKAYSEAASSWDIRLLNNKSNEIMDTSMPDDSQVTNNSDLNFDGYEIEMVEENRDTNISPEICEENEAESKKGSKSEELMDQSVTEISEETDSVFMKKLEDDVLPESDWKSKWITKSLLAHMVIFGKFRSPKSLFREPELNKIFHDFLSSRVADIQRSALDFILSYKHKNLIPYKDHLYGLIDDKTFRNELTLFRIDSQSDLVKEEHRPNLIPIVLRIVYSKMYSKVIASKRETRQARKAAILRFLSGCSGEELTNFFNMAFNNIIGLVKDFCEPMIEEIDSCITLEECIPPRRLLMTAQLIDTVIKHCGGLLQPLQISLILRLLIIVATYPANILHRREEVHPGYIKVLKNVKMTCFGALSHFCETFENYTWSEDEINGMFKVMIWPYLENMLSEGVNSPTAQLKLFIQWSKNCRLFYLLDKKNNLGNSALSTMVQLWSLPKLHLSVHNALIDLVYNLISIRGEEKEKSDSEILNTYMPKIMDVLQERLCRKRFLTKKELSVLSAVTLSDSENISPESLLAVVLPSLLKSSKNNEEEITDLLNTVGNLAIKTTDSSKYLKELVTLFSSLQAPGHRKLLLSKIFDISKHCGKQLDESVLLDLNAWDPKWVEQPDFNRRLQAFSNIEQMDEFSSSVLAAVVIRTSYHYLKDEKDLSLKDSARHCLRKLCPKVCLSRAEEKDELAFLLDETILPLLKSGLNDDSEIIRQECISLLGYLVRECSSVHHVLKDLFPFSNKADLEVDFFENIVHLQLHRRVRAMLRFAEISERLERGLHPRTLMFFVLPMISQYLLSPKYANKNTIVDSAIKALGSVCHSLSWRYYYVILRFYLGKMQSGIEFQKQIIRIVSEILNAFHFDLSQADEFYSNVSLGKLDNKLPEGKKEESLTQEDILVSREESLLEEEHESKSADEETKGKCLKDIALHKSSANKVVFELAGVILPNLQKLLGNKCSSDSLHKVNKKMTYTDKDEDAILRIPLAIAIVKLLQKLPSSNLLERNLPGIFLKLSNYLKSRGESVRKSARMTLETIMTSLGPRYLPRLVSELCALLTKGFHVHVLTYTLHGVLSRLKPLYSKGDIDPCIQNIISVCISDLFGTVSEEKEVNQITVKTAEAKANRSFDLFYILAAYSSENYLLDLILPLKLALGNTVSHKSIKKASDCLQQIALGLTVNQYLLAESLLEFSYGVSTESIPALTSKQREEFDCKHREYEYRKGPDPFLIPHEPKQKKALMTTECMKTNAHILVEFGLKLLYFLLKREKLNKPQFKPMLDPLVKLLLDCLKSKHVTVSTVALKCFAWVLRMDLPSIDCNIKEISNTILEILHRYAAAGLSKGDNFHLVMAAFKAVSVLVRSCKSWIPESDERRVLLLYCEQDIDDRERQATAFSLLKALIQKGVSSEELNSVMKKVANVSIASPLDSVRLQARQVMLTYLMEYKVGHELLAFLSFYLSQLSYQTKIGRESALEMLRALVVAFPQETLNAECGIIFVNAATRLVNEEDADCRKEVAGLIVLLIQKLEQNSKDKLFDVTTAWINGKKGVHKRLGMQLAGLFVTAEKDNFTRRLEQCLSLITNELHSSFSEHKPGRFVLIRNQARSPEGDNTGDHLAFHTLHSLLKIFTLIPISLKDNKYAEYIEKITDECQALLGHEHEWVRTQAIQILGLILTTKQSKGTKSLALDLLSQLFPGVGESLLMQSMKLLVHIADMVSSHSSTENDVSLQWLVRKVRQAVNKEIVHFPTSNQIRKMACKWGAALSVKLKRDILQSVAFELLTPIVKCMSSEDSELAKAAKEAGGYIKGKLGQTEYNNLLTQISQNIDAKKALRKKERNQLAVTDPERAAKRKMNRQIKKKAMKKRKVELMKKHIFRTKKQKTEIEIEI